MPRPSKVPKIVNGQKLWACSRCGLYKSASSYYRDKRKSNGLASRCIECEEKRAEGRREYFRRYSREYVRKCKARFFATKRCSICLGNTNLKVYAREGKTIRQLRPWYGKTHGSLYFILCSSHAREYEVKRNSKRTIRLWKEGKYEHLRGASVPEFYPFIEGEPLPEHSLIVRVHNFVPRGLPEDLRRDICQDILLAILSGEHTVESAEMNVQGFVKAAWKIYPSKFVYSLNHPPPWARDSDRTLLETLTYEDIAT